MPKNVLIGTFGGGPIAISLLDCLWELHNLHFDKLILVSTRFPGIKKGYHDLKAHVRSDCPVCKERYQNLDLYLTEIARDDIATEEDHQVLLSSLIKSIRQESQPDTDIYLGLTGGRRGMYVIFTFVSMLFPVAGLYDSMPRDTQLTKQAWINVQEWNKKSNEEKATFWESESNTWGLAYNSLDQPPPTLGWHFNVEKDFSLVRLPFEGLTPFLDAFIHQLKRPPKVPSRGTERDWTKRGIEIFRRNQDVVEAIRSLESIFETSIEEVTTPVLLRLEQNDRWFWHDCIKHGANLMGCKIRTLKEKWELQKGIFIVSKIGDPLFKEFDAVFKDGRKPKDVKDHFKKLYDQLNTKIFNVVKSRSQPLKEWLGTIAKKVQKEETPRLIRIIEEDCNARLLTICTGPELDLVMKELLQNSIQHGDGDVIIRITEQGIIIKNKGEFNSTKWRKSPRSQHTKIICEDYHLRFQISSDIDKKEVNTLIFWDLQPRYFLPVNAKTIVEGGNY